jgi:hypothetical protein
MAKIIKKGRYGTVRRCEEHDPIYQEGLDHWPYCCPAKAGGAGHCFGQAKR